MENVPKEEKNINIPEIVVKRKGLLEKN